MAWTVSWKVFVDGYDLTEAMRPFLIAISVTDKDGAASDACSLTFDGTEGQLRLPGDGAFVRVLLDRVQVFAGTVDSVKVSGSRGGGRLIEVGAKGFDSRGKVKEPQQLHMDDSPLGDFLGKAAENAGFSISVDPELAGITRDYWAADTESFLHLGQRLARELYGTFKLRGTKAVLTRRGTDSRLPGVEGIFGDGGNVISFAIAPITGRRAFTKAKVTYFDRGKAAYQSEDVTIESDRALPESTNVIRSTAKDRDQARDIAEARKRESGREGGEGSITLDLTPGAQAEAPFHLSGAYPGVDGTYRVVTVTHKASRSGGSTTSLELKQPSGAAGKDSRKGRGTGPAGAGSGNASGTPGNDDGASNGSPGSDDGPVLDHPGDGPE